MGWPGLGVTPGPHRAEAGPTQTGAHVHTHAHTHAHTHTLLARPGPRAAVSTLPPPSHRPASSAVPRHAPPASEPRCRHVWRPTRADGQSKATARPLNTGQSAATHAPLQATHSVCCNPASVSGQAPLPLPKEASHMHPALREHRAGPLSPGPRPAPRARPSTYPRKSAGAWRAGPGAASSGRSAPRAPHSREAGGRRGSPGVAEGRRGSPGVAEGTGRGQVNISVGQELRASEAAMCPGRARQPLPPPGRLPPPAPPPPAHAAPLGRAWAKTPGTRDPRSQKPGRSRGAGGTGHGNHFSPDQRDSWPQRSKLTSPPHTVRHCHSCPPDGDL